MNLRSRLNLEMMVKNFYYLTVFALIIGGVTFFSIKIIGDELSAIKNSHLPVLTSLDELQISIEDLANDAEGVIKADTYEGRDALVKSIKDRKGKFIGHISNIKSLATPDDDKFIGDIESKAKSLFEAAQKAEVSGEELLKGANQVKTSIKIFRSSSVIKIGDRFNSSETALERAISITIILTLLAIIGMITLGFILSRSVGRPVSKETEQLISRSREIEEVFAEIRSGTNSQTEVVRDATRELEEMIINIIQGKISLSVDKQREIARGFSEFLKHFVERTSVEIAMGMMSVSQQSEEARKGVENFLKEVSRVETNIKSQEAAIEQIVAALKSIVNTNREIKDKVRISTDAADKATQKASTGQQRIGEIYDQLQEIGSSSEVVHEITGTLGKIAENIKILALNMSLKVEDVKDDTGKTYGFETMSAKVQKLAEEVEQLLERSREMMIPTIQGIQSVSMEASRTRDLIDEIVKSIKMADDESKSISMKIDRQASDIDKVESEAENLRDLAHRTTAAVEAQGSLTREIDTLLKDSVTLINSVNAQTQESSDGARKVNQMMGQLKETMVSIEEGTGELTDKSSHLSDMFGSISELAENNMNGAAKLEGVTVSIRDISNNLSVVVKGQAS